jgi:hypothetical protein
MLLHLQRYLNKYLLIKYYWKVPIPLRLLKEMISQFSNNHSSFAYGDAGCFYLFAFVS